MICLGWVSDKAPPPSAARSAVDWTRKSEADGLGDHVNLQDQAPAPGTLLHDTLQPAQRPRPDLDAYPFFQEGIRGKRHAPGQSQMQIPQFPIEPGLIRYADDTGHPVRIIGTIRLL